ncbi:hypothetical protein [uncultured Lactobacillus sp.]|uniref:hypothetical protein n=1 Tax=uncultured Lactobacillus sp. TaxID=153152 RepID=UPI00280410F2|nr:hypothetical protein [uncultured Lactobacillus sp.]
MDNPSNKQIAHDMAMAFVQADLNEMTGNQRQEELLLINRNAKVGKAKSTTIMTNYQHAYSTIRQYLDSVDPAL